MQTEITNLMEIVFIQKDPCGSIKMLVYMQHLFRGNHFLYCG